MLESIIILLDTFKNKNHKSDIIDLATGKNKYPKSFKETWQQIKKETWQK